MYLYFELLTDYHFVLESYLRFIFVSGLLDQKGGREETPSINTDVSSRDDRVEITVIEDDKENMDFNGHHPIRDRDSIFDNNLLDKHHFGRLGLKESTDKEKSETYGFEMEASKTVLTSRSPSKCSVSKQQLSVGTFVIHRDESRLDNVLDEYESSDSQSESNPFYE